MNRIPPPIQDEVNHIRYLMSCWSEDKWCAGWMMNLEHEIWNADGQSDPEIYEIHYRAQQLGVWVTLDSVVPIEKWIEQYGEPVWWAEV